MAAINSRKLHHRSFDHPEFLSNFHISPEHRGFVNDVAHIVALALSPKSLRSSLLWCSTTVRIRVGAMMNERRSASMPLLVLLPINPVSKRTQCHLSRFLGHHYLHCQLSPLKLLPPKLVWRLQIPANALMSWCNIPVPFICYPLLNLSFSFLGLGLGPTPIFTAIDCYP